MGTLHREAGARARARASYEEGLRRRPDNAALLDVLATLELRLGRYDQAEALYRRALDS